MNEVGAKNTDKKKKDETSQVEMELFLNVIFDGLGNYQCQKARRDAYRNSESLDVNPSEDFILGFEGNENESIPQSPNAMVENELIKHETIIIDMSTGIGYGERVKRVRDQIERCAQKYYEKLEVKSLTVHLFLFFYRQGDPAVNLMADLEPETEQDAKERIKQVFSKELLKSPKVKYKGIEYIGSFDPTSDDLTSQKVDNSSENDTDAPTEQDVIDAAVLCQFTYDTQKAKDQSIIKSVVQAVKSIFKKKEKVNTTDTPITDPSGKEIGWRMMEESEVSTLTGHNQNFKLKSASSGLYSQVFYKSTPNDINSNVGIVKFAYCTAGTNMSSLADWFTNIAQGLIGWAPQYVQSVRNAKILDQSTKANPLLFIGHSLGGGLASNNALATKSRHAITFNAAGLNPLRVKATLLINNRGALFHIKERRSRIHAYIIKGEILHVILRFLGQMPYGYDREHSYVVDKTNMINTIKQTLSRHKLLQFLEDAKLKETLVRNRA